MTVERGEAAKPERDELNATLAGDAHARRRLVTRLLPVVHARVARCLMRRRGSATAPQVRELVEDYSQDVFEHLFRDDARALRNWDPLRGLNLRNYVGMVAEQRVLAALRSRRQNPWVEEPTCAAKLAAVLPPSSAPDQQVVARQLLDRVMAAMRAGLSAQGVVLFERLIVQQQSVATVALALGMKPPAVHAWSSRLKRRLRRELAALEDPESQPQGSQPPCKPARSKPLEAS